MEEEKAKGVEDKVTYKEGETIRVLRGNVSEDEHFIIILREDGEVRINKNCVIKIERMGGR